MSIRREFGIILELFRNYPLLIILELFPIWDTHRGHQELWLNLEHASVAIGPKENWFTNQHSKYP